MSASQRFSISGVWLNRLILWASLLGMILAIHLWIQKARGFDQGCLGLDTHGIDVSEGGCVDAGLEASSHLFGVSNAAWGYAFYFGLALLWFGKIVTPTNWQRWLHRLGEIAVTGALLYSAYLVYQMGFVAHAWCPLCVLSATLVALVFGLLVTLRFRGAFAAIDEVTRGWELGLASGALFGAMGLLVAVLVFVDRLGTRSLDDGNGAVEMRRIVGRSLPAYIDAEKLFEMRACHFDGMAPPLDITKFIRSDMPFLGRAGGVSVVVFLDPHCPHCRNFLPTYLKLAEKYQERARFYVLPHVLWEFSTSAVAALELAEKSGKYFETWQKELEAAKTGRLTIDRLTGIYREVGLDSAGLADRIETIRPRIEAETRRDRTAGIQEAPSIFIDGYKVFPVNYSFECLEKLIELSSTPRLSGSKVQESH